MPNEQSEPARSSKIFEISWSGSQPISERSIITLLIKELGDGAFIVRDIVSGNYVQQWDVGNLSNKVLKDAQLSELGTLINDLSSVEIALSDSEDIENVVLDILPLALKNIISRLEILHSGMK